MEEESASYEEVHLCSVEYIARVAMTVRKKLYTWSHHTRGNPGNLFSTIFA